MKKLLSFLFLFVFIEYYSQELLCNVRVNAAQIQTSDRKIFQTMQTSLYEFVNNTKWTDKVFSNEERIECTMLISIQEMVSNDEFKVLQEIYLDSNKTSHFVSFLKKLKLNDKRVIILASSFQENLILASRNLRNIHVANVKNVSVYD